jgi:hypothetical protein
MYYIPAGLFYIQGGLPDPASMVTNPEHPPFAKYIIGFFALYLHNANLASLTFSFLSAVIVFLLVRRFIGDALSASVAVMVMGFDEIQITMSIDPMLDVFMIFFGSLGLYIVLSARTRPMYLLSGVVLGFAVASKWYGALFLVPSIIWLAENRRFTECALLFTSATIAYVFSYMPFIVANGFAGFLSLQAWMIQFTISRHSGTYGTVEVVNRLIGPFFYLSKFNPLYRLANLILPGNYYMSLNEGVNPLVALLPYPSTYWEARRYFAGHKNPARHLLLLTMVSFLFVHIVFMDPFESWLFAPITIISAIFIADILHHLATGGLRDRLFVIAFLSLGMIWTLLMITIGNKLQ